MTYQYERILQEIRDGVEYPDFWTNRYGEEDEPEQECSYTRSWEEVGDNLLEKQPEQKGR